MKQRYLWTLFAATAVAMQMVYRCLWMIEPWFELQAVLSVLNAALAVGILIRSKAPRRWTIPGVAVGLIVGQIWQWESFATRIIWSINGFAP